MNIPLAIIALFTITWLPHAVPQRITVDKYAVKNNYTRRVTRETSADQMVHNILNWLEGIEADTSRKVRQNGLRTYLPPNTQKPRPFEPTTPEENTIAGMLPPEPQLPPEETSEPQYPGAPEQTPSPEPGPNEITFPLGPEIPSKSPGQQPPEEQSTPADGGVIGGYTPPEEITPRPPFVSPPQTPEGPGDDQSPGYAPAGETPQPPFPPIVPSTPEEPEVSTPYPPIRPEPGFEGPGDDQGPGYAPAGETPQPPFPPIVPSTPEEPEVSTPYPPIRPEPGFETPQPPSVNLPETPEGPGDGESTGYPPAGQTPQPPFGIPEVPRETPDIPAPPGQPVSPPGEGVPPAETPGVPAVSAVTETSPEVPGGPGDETTVAPKEADQPGVMTTSTFPPILRETEGPIPSEPSGPPDQEPSITETQPTLPEVNGSQPPQPETTQTGETPSLPDVNVVEPTPEEPPEPEGDDTTHPPHIHGIEVDCAREMMTINIEFNRAFDGIIYSKGFYNNPDCRYVNERSGQTTYSFSVSLDSCGTQFINAFDTEENQSYLENVLVIQNEAGIQEVWDTVRSVRCLWEGSLSKSLNISLSVSMLSEEIVTFSGDTAVARLDIQRGEGPFAPSATGLVPIGEKMTLVVSVSGDPGFDIQVRDCKAKDTDGGLEYALTDEDGCVLRPKLFGAFQKTRNTGNTDASIIAYAFFSAFKFPDVMDLTIECNVELCKTDCDVCPNPDQKIQPGKRRRRAAHNETLGDPIRVGKLLRVLLPEDLSDGEKLVAIKQEKEFCMTFTNFVVSFIVLISVLLCSACFCFYMYLKRRSVAYKHQF